VGGLLGFNLPAISNGSSSNTMLKDFNEITPGIWIVNSSSILNPPFATPKSGLAVAFAGTDNLVRMTLFVSYNTDFVVIRGSIGSDWKRLV
jgi:hypothetical protein